MIALRVGLVCDLQEEKWPSMDLVGEMLLAHLNQHHSETITAARVCAPFHRRFTRLGHLRPLFSADRFLNRWRDYPRFVSGLNGRFDVYHVVDHSYSHLVHHLSSRRVIVTCHDLDAFRCLIEPNQEHRPKLFRRVAEYVLTGLQKAVCVVCDSRSTKDELVSHGLVPDRRLVVNPLGAHPVYSPDGDPSADDDAIGLLGPPSVKSVELLHVGSTIPRKRIDVLLRVFAEIRRTYPKARLVRLGGPFTSRQLRLQEQLGLNGAIRVLPFQDLDVLAALYRRASLVLLPSDREGFGLPVVEAMACGTPVVASAIPAVMEVGGDAVTYCRVGDVEHWTETVLELLRECREEPDRWASRREACIRRAATFTWQEHARRMVELYQRVLNS